MITVIPTQILNARIGNVSNTPGTKQSIIAIATPNETKIILKKTFHFKRYICNDSFTKLIKPGKLALVLVVCSIFLIYYFSLTTNLVERNVIICV